MKSGRRPALNDFNLRVAGVIHGFLGRGRFLPKHLVAHTVMVFLKSSHWCVDSARAS